MKPAAARRASVPSRLTSTWDPASTAPTPHEAAVLGNVAAAAGIHGVRVYVSVYHAGSQHDAADAGGAGRVRVLHGRDRAARTRPSAT